MFPPSCTGERGSAVNSRVTSAIQCLLPLTRCKSTSVHILGNVLTHVTCVIIDPSVYPCSNDTFWRTQVRNRFNATFVRRVSDNYPTSRNINRFTRINNENVANVTTLILSCQTSSLIGTHITVMRRNLSYAWIASLNLKKRMNSWNTRKKNTRGNKVNTHAIAVERSSIVKGISRNIWSAWIVRRGRSVASCANKHSARRRVSRNTCWEIMVSRKTTNVRNAKKSSKWKSCSKCTKNELMGWSNVIFLSFSSVLLTRKFILLMFSKLFCIFSFTRSFCLAIIRFIKLRVFEKVFSSVLPMVDNFPL